MKTLLKPIILIFLLPLVLYAADWERMKTNIRVQEKILNTMFEDSPDFWLISEAKGIYIPEFGAVFSFRLSDSEENAANCLLFNFPGLDLQTTVRTFTKAVEDYNDKFDSDSDTSCDVEKDEEISARKLQIIGEKMEKHSQKMEEKARELEELSRKLEKQRAEQNAELIKSFHIKVGKLQSELKEYITDYGATLDLPPNERVLLRAGLESMLPIEDSQCNFEISADATDLNRLRKGAITPIDFAKTIRVRELNNGDELPSDIKIMKNILNTAFEDRNKDRFIFCFGSSGEEAWSSYIAGFGALFYRAFSLGPMISFKTTDSDEPAAGKSKKENDITIFVDSWKSDSAGEKSDKMLCDLEDEISDLLVIYTPTLKSVKSEENIVVAIKIGERQAKNKPNMMIIKIPKKAVEKSKDEKELKNQIVKLKI